MSLICLLLVYDQQTHITTLMTDHRMVMIIVMLVMNFFC